MKIVWNGCFVDGGRSRRELDAREIFGRHYRGEKIKDIAKSMDLSPGNASSLGQWGRTLMRYDNNPEQWRRK